MRLMALHFANFGHLQSFVPRVCKWNTVENVVVPHDDRTTAVIIP